MAKQQTSQPYKGHVWHYRMERTSQPVVHEFGMAITKEEAERRIAAMNNLEKLPAGAVVSHRELEKLDELTPRVMEAKKPD